MRKPQFVADEKTHNPLAKPAVQPKRPARQTNSRQSDAWHVLLAGAINDSIKLYLKYVYSCKYVCSVCVCISLISLKANLAYLQLHTYKSVLFFLLLFAKASEKQFKARLVG